MRITRTDHDRVSAAVTAAERGTAGEIVAVVAGRSDSYRDVAAYYGVLAMLLVLALLAAAPGIEGRVYALIDPWAEAVPPSALLLIAMLAAALAFALVTIAFAVDRVRFALTPGAVKTHRVHARALALFRTAAERRTTAETGVLLYLSLAEHRAEIIADAAIHGRVAPEVWGHAMTTLIAAVKDGRPGDGIAEAVGEIGAILTEHFPRDAGDRNELPDRLIEL